jgi:Flp pilus assembly protein TadD
MGLHLFETSSAVTLHNKGLQLDKSGDDDGAEVKYLEAVRMKKHSLALTQNALGNLYLKKGELDKAQEMLEAADALSGKYSISEEEPVKIQC